MSTILVVDDERNIVSGLKEGFEDEGYSVLTASNGKEAWNTINNNDVDLVITDLRMPEMTGNELIKQISSHYPTLPVIALTGHGNIETAVQTIREGAVDFLTKPFDFDKLSLIVKKSLEAASLRKENKRLSQELERMTSERKIIGHSKKLEKVMDSIKTVAPTITTVLITGESGTGKELVADAIQSLSNRSGKSFVKVNCASLSPTLLESELFGHERGAFTTALTQTKGRFELSNGGTIFLDEIGEIDESTQIKLLRVLENKEITRVGGEKTINVDVRVIAATNKDLKQLVKDGKFREDLYFRLAVFTIDVPPLRERKEDIDMLSLSFVKEFSKLNNKGILDISPSARKALFSYSWPGNIRELKNVIEVAVVMAKGKRIELEDLPESIRSGNDKNKAVTLTFPFTMDSAEKEIILQTISYCNGNKSKAAEMLKIGRKTLHRKLSKPKEEDFDE